MRRNEKLSKGRFGPDRPQSISLEHICPILVPTSTVMILKDPKRSPNQGTILGPQECQELPFLLLFILQGFYPKLEEGSKCLGFHLGLCKILPPCWLFFQIPPLLMSFLRTLFLILIEWKSMLVRKTNHPLGQAIHPLLIPVSSPTEWRAQSPEVFLIPSICVTSLYKVKNKKGKGRKSLSLCFAIFFCYIYRIWIPRKIWEHELQFLKKTQLGRKSQSIAKSSSAEAKVLTIPFR